LVLMPVRANYTSLDIAEYPKQPVTEGAFAASSTKGNLILTSNPWFHTRDCETTAYLSPHRCHGLREWRALATVQNNQDEAAYYIDLFNLVLTVEGPLVYSPARAAEYAPAYNLSEFPPPTDWEPCYAVWDVPNPRTLSIASVVPSRVQRLTRSGRGVILTTALRRRKDAPPQRSVVFTIVAFDVHDKKIDRADVMALMTKRYVQPYPPGEPIRLDLGSVPAEYRPLVRRAAKGYARHNPA
jgi:hypothetical protein